MNRSSKPGGGHVDLHGRQWRARYYADGRPTTRTFTTEAAARAWVDLLRLRRAATSFPSLLDQIVITPAGCWEWHGYISRQGYGHLRANGRKHYAHRLLLEFLGADLKGLHVHHTCRNTRCVNPSHLEPLTPGEHRKRHGESRFCPAPVPAESA